jgi:hypothetical protein
MMGEMTHKVAIYAPRPELVSEVARMLCEEFGGATALPGRGFWIDCQGRLVEDPTTVVFAFTDREQDTAGWVQVAADLAESWGEQCVAVEVNGGLELGYAANALPVPTFEAQGVHA